MNQDVFDKLIEAVPSQIGLVFGFIYLVFITIRKGHDTWTHIHLNRMKVKQEKEKLNQEKIHTKKDEKDLNNNTNGNIQ